MELVIPLALAASFCTATASVYQRTGAKSNEVAGFDVWLVFRLARRPVWLLGIGSMILGFAFQISALRFGPLALVQPILALELLFVFAYMAVSRRVTVRRRDWLAAVAMSAGISLFLRLASPSGGRRHAPGPSWWLAGLITLGIVLLISRPTFWLSWARRRCCWPLMHWPQARSPPPSPDSRSWTRSRPACWDCSCSAST
jgi:drug/metabolite transporter (DMT)-like permease